MWGEVGAGLSEEETFDLHDEVSWLCRDLGEKTYRHGGTASAKALRWE